MARIQWGNASFSRDGETYEVEIQHNLPARAAGILERHLEIALEDLFPDISVITTPARYYKRERESGVDLGSLRLFSNQLLEMNPSQVRTVVSQIAEQAEAEGLAADNQDAEKIGEIMRLWRAK